MQKQNYKKFLYVLRKIFVNEKVYNGKVVESII